MVPSLTLSLPSQSRPVCCFFLKTFSKASNATNGTKYFGILMKVIQVESFEVLTKFSRKLDKIVKK